MDTLGNLLAVKVTAANGQERAEVANLSAAVQNATGQTVTLAYANQGGCAARRRCRSARDPSGGGKHTEAKRGFVLLPRRWVVERTFG